MTMAALQNAWYMFIFVLFVTRVAIHLYTRRSNTIILYCYVTAVGCPVRHFYPSGETDTVAGMCTGDLGQCIHCHV